MMPAATCTFCSRTAADHIAGGDAAGGELVGIEPQAHCVIARAEDRDVADAGQAGDFILELERCVVAQEEQVVGVVRRIERDDQRDVGRCFLDRDPLLLHFLGSCGWAIATRFCTCTWATSRFVPTLNVTVRCMPPSLVDWLDM